MKTNRRDFAKLIASSTLGVSFLPDNLFSQAKEQKVKHVIYIYMSGGMTHLDTFDPKEDKEVQGPTEIINTNVDGIRFGQHLTGLAKKADSIAVLNSLTSLTGAHAQGKYLQHTSYRKIGSIVHPSLGSWAARLLPKEGSLPNNVLINPESDHPLGGYLPPFTSPLPITNPANAKDIFALKYDKGLLDKRLAALETLNSNFSSKTKETKAYRDFYGEAFKVLNSDDTKVFDISQESKETSEKYGNNRFGQSLLLARRLVESGITFVEVTNGGWDTHTQNFDRLATKLPEVDKGISTLIEDLKQRGLYEDTLIVVATEFGRTPKINVNVGRDHHPRAFSGMMASGKINGKKIGKTDDKGIAVEDKPIQIADFNATIADALGLDIHQTLFSPTKRPFKVTNEGEIIKEVFQG